MKVRNSFLIVLDPHPTFTPLKSTLNLTIKAIEQHTYKIYLYYTKYISFFPRSICMLCSD